MTQNEFLCECAEVCIDPGIALEDPDIVKALLTRDDEAVREALRDNF